MLKIPIIITGSHHFSNDKHIKNLTWLGTKFTLNDINIIYLIKIIYLSQYQMYG